LRKCLKELKYEFFNAVVLNMIYRFKLTLICILNKIKTIGIENHELKQVIHKTNINSNVFM